MSVKEGFYQNPESSVDFDFEYSRLKRRFNKHLRENKTNECRVHNDFTGTCTSQSYTEEEKAKYCDDNDKVKAEFKCETDRPKCRKLAGTELGTCYPDYENTTVQNAIKTKFTEYNTSINSSNLNSYEIKNDTRSLENHRKYLKDSERYKDFEGDWLDYRDGNRDTVETATQDVNAMIVHDNNNYILAFICASTVLVSTLFLIRNN